MREGLIQDIVQQAACRLVAVIAPCLREEEQLDAFHEFCAILREEMERYEARAERGGKRLGKS